MKNKLAELIHECEVEALKSNLHLSPERIADYLLEKGVIVPPCKVGDKVFFVHETCDENGKEGYTVGEGEVHGISKDKTGVWVFCRYNSGLTYYHTASDFGKEVFIPRLEAEKALKEREKTNDRN